MGSPTEILNEMLTRAQREDSIRGSPADILNEMLTKAQREAQREDSIRASQAEILNDMLIRAQREAQREDCIRASQAEILNEMLTRAQREAQREDCIRGSQAEILNEMLTMAQREDGIRGSQAEILNEMLTRAQREAQREDSIRGSQAEILNEMLTRAQREDSIWEDPSTSVHALSDDDQEDVDFAIALSLSEEEHKGKKVIDWEDDEQLAKAIQESWNMESPPRYNSGSISHEHYPFSPTVFRICAGCNKEIDHGYYLTRMDSVWHPDCFRCHACKLPISDNEFTKSRNRPYHKSCYKEPLKCDVCKHFIPTIAGGREYREHSFWKQKYCPSHGHDGTPRCCSCKRMEARDMRLLALDDGRKLCLECLDSAIMDTNECQPLYLEIQDFYEGLNMKLEKPIPLLLVERQALNEAMEGEKNNHHLPETRGLCLFEEQTVSTILRGPKIRVGNMGMITEPRRLIRRSEVTAILILYGLPRLLTGSLLAHEMMHAWLRLKAYPKMSLDVEEGICEVLAHMWLDSEIYSGSGSDVASTSASSSSTSTSSKKGPQSQFEKKLGEFFKHQIESESSPIYGDGYRAANEAVLKYDLKTALSHIRLTGSLPY